LGIALSDLCVKIVLNQLVMSIRGGQAPIRRWMAPNGSCFWYVLLLPVAMASRGVPEWMKDGWPLLLPGNDKTIAALEKLR
jgi:hypothetical protein